MQRLRVSISLEKGTLTRLDRLVRESGFANRSHAIRIAVEEKLKRIERSRLARECARLDPVFEKAMAEEGFSRPETRTPPPTCVT